MAVRICVYAVSTKNATTGKKSIRTRVAPNHASYVRHASKILGWIKNACFRLVCGPSRTPLIYTCLPVACKGAHTRTHTHEHTFVWLPRGYVSNGTYEHARTPQYPYLPRILPAGPALLSSYPGSSPLVFFHELERSQSPFYPRTSARIRLEHQVCSLRKSATLVC